MTVPMVGILSPGDMGHAVGRVLVENGVKVVTCLICSPLSGNFTTIILCRKGVLPSRVYSPH